MFLRFCNSRQSRSYERQSRSWSDHREVQATIAKWSLAGCAQRTTASVSCCPGPPTRRVGLLCSEASSTRPLWLPLPCGLREDSAPPCPDISSSCRKCGRELLSQCVHAPMTAVRGPPLARLRCCCHSTCSPPRLRSHLYFELNALPARAARLFPRHINLNRLGPAIDRRLPRSIITTSSGMWDCFGNPSALRRCRRSHVCLRDDCRALACLQRISAASDACNVWDFQAARIKSENRLATFAEVSRIGFGKGLCASRCAVPPVPQRATFEHIEHAELRVAH